MIPAARMLAVLGLLAGTLAAAAAAVTETLPVRHRPAAELAPLLRPLAGPDGAVVAAGDALVVRATPERLEAVREALRALDRAPRRLRLTVRALAAGERLDAHAGADIAAGPGGAAVTARVRSTRARETARRGQSVEALEGRWVRIATGALLPYLERSVTVTGAGTTTTESVGYRPALTGFLARARLAADGSVTVEIRAADERTRDGAALETAGLETVVRGRPGEWLPLGGAAGTERRRTRSLLARTRDTASRSLRWYLRVDVLDGAPDGEGSRRR